MKKLPQLSALLICLLIASWLLSGCSKTSPSQQSETGIINHSRSSSTSASAKPQITQPTPTPPATPFTATFEIYTTGTKRTFTQAMYHQQSPAAFIDRTNPNQVQVQQAGITWQVFFDSLPAPFSLSKDCLVTGTGQRLCSGPKNTLHFILNDQEEPNVLQKPINKDDHLIIRYQ